MKQNLCTVILFSLTLISCASNKEIEKWAGKIYSYQVNEVSFMRKQDNEAIKYNDPKANGFFCMTPQDFIDFLTTYVVNNDGTTKVSSPKLKSPKDS